MKRFPSSSVAALTLLICNACVGSPQDRGTAGVFDFYVLSLSWSPEFCHGHPNDAQCGEKHGFVVHGLWPQNNDGSYPLSCATDKPAPTDTSPVSRIMPQSIIEHEWEKHGTCSGLSGNGYLRLIRGVFNSVRIPGDLTSPSQSFTLTPSRLKRDFEAVNSTLADQDIAVQLNHGYLNAVEICFSRANRPAPLACPNMRDVRGGTFRVPAVR